MLTALVSVWLDLSVWLLLGALVSALLHRWVPDSIVQGHLSGRAGVLKAVAFGVPMPLCSCSVIPAGLGLKKQGASDGATVGFLISTPQTGVDSVFVSASLLGWPFALFKVATAAVTGVAAGLWVGSGTDGAAPVPVAEHSATRSWKSAAAHFLDVLQPIWKWLVAGVALSAFITELVPPTAFAALGSGGGLVIAMLVALALSLPLYVCATASVPIAAGLVAAGLPVGAAIVFLIAGPATNVATVGAIYRVLGRRNLFIYLSTIVVGSMLGGLAFQELLQTGTFAGPAHAGHHGPIAVAGGVVLAALVAYFGASELSGWWSRRKRAHTEAAAMEIPVAGLTCDGCVRRLESALRADAGVKEARVQREPGQAHISGDLTRERAEHLIQAAGFTVPERSVPVT